MLTTKEKALRIISGVFISMIITAAAAYFIFFRDIPHSVYDGCMSCGSNMKEMGTALERYYKDKRKYPKGLDELEGVYVKTVPRCMDWNRCNGRAAAYYKKVHGLDMNREYQYTVSKDRLHYTIVCNSGNHCLRGMPPGYPQYDSREGLNARP